MAGIANKISFLGVLAISCGAAKVPPRVSAPNETAPASAVSRFFPLVDGTQWAYEAEEEGTGNKGIFVTRARSAGGARYSLTTGQRSHSVELRPEGLVKVETGTYLLRAPLSVGAEWPGDGGATIRVGAIDTMVDVPAGQFVGCLDTLEEAREGSAVLRRITTTYCPDVGIVSLHVEAWEGGKHAGERAVLRSFGKPVTLQ